MKDWKIVFNTRSYHYVFIKHINNDQYLDFFYEHQFEIETEKSFFFLMPTANELKDLNNKDIINKYRPLLRAFLTAPDKVTLFAEENLLKSLIKEDGRRNFFELLIRNKKNVVLFCHEDLDKDAISNDYIYTYMTREDLERQLSLFQSFNKIKNAIEKTYNPFKNPANAFDKLKKDN